LAETIAERAGGNLKKSVRQDESTKDPTPQLRWNFKFPLNSWSRTGDRNTIKKGNNRQEHE
jgi:hypothetical protein